MPGVTLEPVGTLVSKLRAVKDTEEIATLRRAQAITVAAFTSVAPRITAGMTEKQVAWELEKAVRDAGGAGMAFSTIVGAGENGARPHHGASDRPIREGEPIVIDMGAVYEGYCGDLTRTIVVGEPDEKFRQVYDVVLRAMRHVEEIARPGMTGGEIDAAAREVITDAGFGEYFIHSLGHGVGLQVHEGPSARAEGEDIYAPGMTLTVEPGIYLEGWGGVRIEDLVILNESGMRISRMRPCCSYGCAAVKDVTPHVAILSSLDACMMRGVHSVPASRHLAHRAEYPVHAVWGKHMVTDTGGLKKGIALDLDGQLLRVMDYQHIKTARGSATIKITVRNLRTGATTEKSFQNGTRFNVATLEHRSMQYLYPDEDGNSVFIDQETYEQPVLSKGILGNSVNYIRENDIVDILTYGDEPVEINSRPPCSSPLPRRSQG